MLAHSKPIGESLRLFLRFGLVGLLNAVFGYAVFALLIWLGIEPSVALVVATVAGTLFNFQTSRRLVFRSRGDAARFIAVYVVVLAINWTALRMLRRYGVAELEAQAILTLPVAALSFIGQRRFVFGRVGGTT